MSFLYRCPSCGTPTHFSVVRTTPELCSKCSSAKPLERDIELDGLRESFRQHLLNAVNASCSCGGKSRDLGCCQACEVWHRFIASTEEGKWEEIGKVETFGKAEEIGKWEEGK